MNKEIVKTALRVPTGPHQRIHEEVKHSGRTFNAEVVFGMAQRYGVTLRKDRSKEPENAQTA